MSTVKVYEGGIASFDSPPVWPPSSDQGQMFQPDPTSGEIDTTAGGPASGSGKSSDGGFVMDNKNNYGGPSDLDEGIGSMKVIDLDDIKGVSIVDSGTISSQTDGY